LILTLHIHNCGLEIAVTYILSVIYVTSSDGSYSDRIPWFKNTSTFRYNCPRTFRVT